jgi:hypothetical protein
MGQLPRRQRGRFGSSGNGSLEPGGSQIDEVAGKPLRGFKIALQV